MTFSLYLTWTTTQSNGVIRHCAVVWSSNPTIDDMVALGEHVARLRHDDRQPHWYHGDFDVEELRIAQKVAYETKR